MGKQVLITGGAGFIGSHLADELLSHGHKVRVLDNLCPQVHGDGARKPEYLSPDVEFIKGDIREAETVKKAIRGVEALYHFAAAVGVGQSMYEIEKYVDVNSRGTAVLLEAITNNPVEKLIVASSMSIYGEGLYESRQTGARHHNSSRGLDQLRKGEWEVRDEKGEPLVPVLTPEEKVPSLSSIYALTKYDQERACLMTGRAYKVPTVAMRFFNVFGTRQSCSNPYTGVLAIFSSRVLNKKPPLIYEDGLQMRDFVSVKDVAKACRLALMCREAEDMVFNIGSGRPHTVLDVAKKITGVFGEKIEPEITGKYRMGDIRHCFADISLARKVLKYEPSVNLDEGLAELGKWMDGKTAHDKFAQASRELAGRGLTI